MTKTCTIPIDEMLIDLRAALEVFENNPTDDNLDKVFAETKRINKTCEEEN